VDDASPAAGGLVESWFGSEFASLHPMLQQLHRHGGELKGEVEVSIPVGLPGIFGRLLARKLSVPAEGVRHAFSVRVSHHADGLHWDRCFDERTVMASVFAPVGSKIQGYWLERTGPLRMRLTVDIIDGGWHWRCLQLRWRAVPLPMWLFPKSRAFKLIENEHYRFYVGFSLPLLGTVLSYSGLLHMTPDR
jgi:hypothetical protein